MKLTKLLEEDGHSYVQYLYIFADGFTSTKFEEEEKGVEMVQNKILKW